MNRWIAGLLVTAVAAAVIAGAVTAAPAGPPIGQTGTNATGANGTTDLSPGERLAGVVGVQSAEIEGEVESRAFEVALRRSENNESRGAVVAERLNRTEARLAELRQEQDELHERLAAGELSQGAYAARMAATTARIETLSRGLNRSASAAAELPAAVRNETGVDDGRLATLRERANELSGPEVAAIARGVAGEGVGGPIGNGRGPPSNETDRGPPEDAGPPGDGTDRGPPEGAGPPGDGTDRGPPEGAGPPGDDTDRGPPEEDSENESTGPPGERAGNVSGGPPEEDSTNGPRDAPGRDGTGGGDGASRGESPGDSGGDGMNRSEGDGERGAGPSEPSGDGAADGGESGNGSGGPPSGPGNGTDGGAASADESDSDGDAAALSGTRPAGVRPVAVVGSP